MNSCCVGLPDCGPDTATYSGLPGQKPNSLSPCIYPWETSSRFKEMSADSLYPGALVLGYLGPIPSSQSRIYDHFQHVHLEQALILGMQTRRGKLSESLCKGSLEVDLHSQYKSYFIAVHPWLFLCLIISPVTFTQ